MDNTCCCIVSHLASPLLNSSRIGSTYAATTYTGISASRVLSSGCIPSDLGANVATCCHDNKNSTLTGCGVGYQCAIRWNNDNHPRGSKHDNVYYCRADPIMVPDPLVQILPRYHLCRASHRSDFSKLYGLTLSPWSGLGHASGRHHRREQQQKRMPYYSSHGDLDL